MLLNKDTHFRKQMYKEITEIEKCPGNFNGEDRWKISKTCRIPIIQKK